MKDLRTKGGQCEVKIILAEQAINDKVTGLRIEISRVESSTIPFRLRLFGDILPFSNREFVFDESGRLAGTGTGLCPDCTLSSPYLDALDILTGE